MSLTPQQVDYVMHMGIDQILQFIADGKVVFPDDLRKYAKDPKYKEIEYRLQNSPDPEAVKSWAEIQSLLNGDTPAGQLADRLTAFINRYNGNASCAPMIDEARLSLGRLTAEIESDDWNKVNPLDVTSLLAHRRKYPATIHESEIDNMVWELTDKTSTPEINRYSNEFPTGLHHHQCQAIIDAQELWKGVRTDADPVTVNDYITEETSSPFIPDAVALMSELKHNEILKMKDAPGKYRLDWLKLLLEEKIFSRDELVKAQVCTPKTLDFIENDRDKDLPEIEQIGQTNPPVIKGPTDVFLFGIPSSGKTCVLMGLLGAEQFSYDNADEGHGGDYADKLKIFRDNGKAPGRTYTNFVTQIRGEIRPDIKQNLRFPINLIEMSGEEFAMHMVYNENQVTDFEQMGTGATKLLSSDNRKVIFIIIDPTADGLIKISTQLEDGSSRERVVQQEIVIDKIVNMLKRNDKLLKRTNAINFIMTKADKLGDRDDRDQIAIERVLQLYRKTINNLKDICHKYSINITSGCNPRLFTFSLGTFYIGDLFEYDPTDADNIMDNLTSMCQGEQSKGFGSKLKDILN